MALERLTEGIQEQQSVSSHFSLLEVQCDILVVAEVGKGRDAVRLAQKLCPEVEGYVGGLRQAQVDAVFWVLAPRQREVLQLLAGGSTARQIACRLQVSVKTIETHRRHITEELDVHDVAELIKCAVREGMTPNLPRTLRRASGVDMCPTMGASLLEPSGARAGAPWRGAAKELQRWT